EVKNQDFNTFHWSYFEIPTLTSGTKIIEVTNLGSAVALNTVLLISKNDYQQAVETAEKLTSHFNTYNFNDQIVSQEIQKELNNNNYFFVDYNRINPTQYKINIPNNTNWIVFTDHYNQGWNLEDSKSYPFYAMVNGFYLKKNDLNRTLVLYFTPQKTIEYGVLLSLISFSFILILISIFKFKSKFK
ncbi:hypothetical protein HY025_02675, partial [Candidatus Daviesbacteria bacterium]|nr:hypothetical protein [Candidatus Daviesbacteria bacterium]